MTSLIQAHRGYSDAFPENTMLAFREAVLAGANCIECDIWNTSDGEYILIHDWTLDRTTNGTGDVRFTPWADMKDLDAGSWKGPEFADRDDCRIPRFEEFLDEFNGKPVFLLLHCKLPVEHISNLIELINLRNMGHQVMFFGAMNFINAVKQTDSRFFTINAGMPDFSQYQEFLDNAIEHGHSGISVAAGESQANLTTIVNAAHAADKLVMTSYVSGSYPSQMQKMLAVGVDHVLGNGVTAMMAEFNAAELEQEAPGERWPLQPPVPPEPSAGSQLWGRHNGEWHKPVRVWTRSGGVWR